MPTFDHPLYLSSQLILFQDGLLDKEATKDLFKELVSTGIIDNMSEKYKKYIVDCIIKANKEAAPNNASTIKKICILPRDFSVATNELTPTLKLKRGVVVKMNQAAVDAIYNAPKNMTVVPYPITLSEKNSEPSKEE